MRQMIFTTPAERFRGRVSLDKARNARPGFVDLADPPGWLSEPHLGERLVDPAPLVDPALVDRPGGEP